MADQKISQLTTIVTVDTASDLFPIVDTSAAETKKITPSALKTALSLNNVDNTSDANKPISSATQTALDAKQATLVSGTNIKTVNNTSLLGSGNISISSAVAWGGVTGTLSNQTDLQTALDGKVDENTAITGATKTKITYDAKGLITAGADATTADIADSLNKRYVTDSQLTVIGNTSGTNTGDNATNSQYSGLATSKQDTLVSGTNIKTVNSTSLLGSGNISVAPASGIDATAIADGSVTSTEFQYINSLTSNAQTQIDGKQATLVSGTNIKTINSTSLLGSGDIVIGGGSPSGVSGAIQFSDGSAFASDAANLFWDDTNNRLGVGTNTPSATGHFKGSGSTSATTSLLVTNSSGLIGLIVTDDGSVSSYGKGGQTTNAAFGGAALGANTSGSLNAGFGYASLSFNTTGASNTAVGFQSGYGNGTGSNNTAVGRNALISVANYSDNTAVGAFADCGGFSGCTILGKSAIATANNQFVVGSSTTNAGAIDSSSFTQDKRWKVKINGVDYYIALQTA